MVQMYTIAGQKVGSHWLAVGVLSMLFGGGYAAFSGPSASKKITQTPPINASSPDEENFIQKFLDQANKDEKESKH